MSRSKDLETRLDDALRPPRRRGPKVPPPEVVVVDGESLRAAREALLLHRELIAASLRDLRPVRWVAPSMGVHDDESPEDLEHVLRALDHVLVDGFRSRETRGGS